MEEARLSTPGSNGRSGRPLMCTAAKQFTFPICYGLGRSTTLVCGCHTLNLFFQKVTIVRSWFRYPMMWLMEWDPGPDM